MAPSPIHLRILIRFPFLVIFILNVVAPEIRSLISRTEQSLIRQSFTISLLIGGLLVILGLLIAREKKD